MGSVPNEIPAGRDPTGKLDLKGRTVTLDAMHIQQNRAHCLIEKGADYVFTAVRNNQKAVADDIGVLDFDALPECTTIDHGHGRIEKRSCAVVDLSDSKWMDMPTYSGDAEPWASSAGARSERPAEAVTKLCMD